MTARRLACALGFIAGCAAATAHAAPPTRILLSIGQNIGSESDEPLRYAERDAQHVSEVFAAIGDVAPSRSYLITDASAERVREALAEIRGRSSELGDVILIVYVSSHADPHGLHFVDSVLPFTELRSLLASVPARLRLLITDACTSGTLIRTKGGRAIKPFAIDLEGGRDLAGQVVITSTGSNEPAQEWEALGGSLFTHHLLSGLRGAADRNGDGRVTLFEAYSYSYDHTLAASVGANAGSQHPSHEIDLRGAGDLVLTRPGGRNSGLTLSTALEGRYVVTSVASGELIAEITKVRGQPVRLALDPGRYLVRKPEGAFVLVGELLVFPNSQVILDETAMDPLPYAEVARRGAGPRRTWAFELGGGMRSGLVAGAGITPAIGVALVRERGPLAFALGVEAAMVEFQTIGLTVTQREVWGRADARVRLPLAWTLPYLGLSLGAGFIQQSLVRPREAVIRAVFGSGVLSREGFAARVMPMAGLELPVSGRLSFRLEGGAGVNLVRSERGWMGTLAAVGWLAGGIRF
jgi:Caspase domain